MNTLWQQFITAISLPRSPDKAGLPSIQARIPRRYPRLVALMRHT
jgi:hypothetical protein